MARAEETPRERRRRQHRARRRAMVLVLASPSISVLVCDVVRRAKHMTTFDALHALGYFGSALLSLGFWGAVLAAAARRRGRFRWFASVMFLLMFTAAVAVQGGFFRTYATYCAHDSVLENRLALESWACALPWDERSILAVYLPVAAVLAASILYATRRLVRLPHAIGRRTPVFAIGLGIAIFAVPVSYRVFQSSMPDHIYFHAMGTVLREGNPITRRVQITRTQRRHPAPVPPLRSASEGTPRNVLFILQESVRDDAMCSEYVETCERPARHSNPVLPDRLALTRMRANASSTVISLSVLLSGLGPEEDSATLNRAPYLWGYAKAAGYSTAYWTSQHVQLFGMRFVAQDQPLDRLVVATHLDMGANGDYGAHDRLLVDRVIRDLPGLKEPFFAVVQLANVHGPYRLDPDDAPYVSVGEGKRKQEIAFYRNAVYASDREVARLLSFVKDSSIGDSTIVVFTSDHGESFWEHGADGHTKTVYDPEIRVPAFVWARGSTLRASESLNLRRAKAAPTFHLDLAPTMLDFMGLWDAPEIEAWRARMPGHPLTRAARTTEPVVLTNCSWIWQCRNASIGMMQWPFKVLARGDDKTFGCFNLLEDPNEKKDLGESGCGELPARAHEVFGFMPADVVKDENPPVGSP